ncbi:MAG: hypothetical protein ACLFN8_00205 [Candidatus Woesearchaeota archaeon]
MMKKIFIAGSRKFHEEINYLVSKLKTHKINATLPNKDKNIENDNLENQKIAILDAFKKIDEADAIYVYSKEGYIGKTVAMEIAYAHAKKKEIIAREEIKELSAQALITKQLNEEELIQHCQKI